MFKYIYLDEVDSTNSYIKRNISQLDDMTVVIANKQTAGIGRTGHVWKSEDYQNMTLSIILKHQVSATITQFVGFVVLKLLQSLKIEAMVKWPNDLIVGDKKICGILVESIISDNDYNIIIGIGLNINQTDFGELSKDATSLKNETNVQYEIKSVINDFLELFEKYLYDYYDNSLDYLDELKQHAYLLNQKITFNYHGKFLEGLAIDLASDGCLIVRTNKGDLSINSGEVNMVRKNELKG